jgi:hypothetical protein
MVHFLRVWRDAMTLRSSHIEGAFASADRAVSCPE